MRLACRGPKVSSRYAHIVTDMDTLTWAPPNPIPAIPILCGGSNLTDFVCTLVYTVLPMHYSGVKNVGDIELGGSDAAVLHTLSTPALNRAPKSINADNVYRVSEMPGCTDGGVLRMLGPQANSHSLVSFSFAA